MMRLSALEQVPAALRPGYTPAAHKTGIVHLGLGAFHMAHQAAMTDAALARSGGDWRILGVSLRSPRAAHQLAPQNGLYTLITKERSGTRARIVGALSGAICSAGSPEAALEAMAAPQTRIVSLTVTEKAYGLDRDGQGCDPAHPAVAADLAAPQCPQGVLGLLTAALGRRRRAGLEPFTVLCCDNLPHNGRLLRNAVLDFARRSDPELATWIAQKAAFPSTMVDRITPAASQDTLAEAARLTGVRDEAAVETEAFCQWVIEDSFPLGRPDWDAAGAIFVKDVAPYEEMKLRMLNGSHSMLAYAGYHAGCKYVRDVMADPDLARLVRRQLAAAAATLRPADGIDYTLYAQALAERFENPAIAHETFQIAMDGSEKMPQRIFSAVPEARARGADVRPFAFAAAAWARHLSGAVHDCGPYELRDPRKAELAKMFGSKQGVRGLSELRQADFIPEGVRGDQAFWQEVGGILEDMLSRPMRVVIAQEAQ